MKTLSALFLLIVSFSVLFLSCGKETDYAIETDEWGNLTLTVTEPGVVTNVWVFNTKGSSGKASLQGTGEFDFTYKKDGVNASTLKFDVQGEDKYVMTWTSENSGTFKQYFNGTFGSDGTFSFVK